jgi:hypothetical protein
VLDVLREDAGEGGGGLGVLGDVTDDGAVGEVEVAGRDITLTSNASGGEVVHAVETGSGIPFFG